jgi:hypothetical protein
MSPKEVIAKLLRRLSETLERASPGDVEELLSGQAALVISKANRGSRNSGKGDSSRERREQPNMKRLGGIVVELRRLESRDEGSGLLARAQLTKKELEDLARLMDLPVSREDDAERLKQKIVEESIGARLNSQAIRGS